MKLALPLAAALLLAAPASAQAVCDPYKALIATAAKQLEPLKDESRRKPEPLKGFYPTVTIPAAGDCTYSEPDWGRAYSCVRVFDTEAKARAAASASFAEAKQCLALSGWRRQPVTLDPSDTELIAGAKFTEPRSAPNTTFSIVLQQEALKGKTTYRVGVNIGWWKE
jgi:hypothetical protein